MARKVLEYTITAEGRDKGKMFILTEADSDHGERWFTRLVMALANAGAKIPDAVLFGGAAGFADMLPTFRNSLIVAIRAIQGLAYDDVRVLMDELTPYITWQPTPNASKRPPVQTIIPGADCQIEEVATWFRLRFELVQLHVGFSLAADESTTDQGESPTPEAPTA